MGATMPEEHYTPGMPAGREPVALFLTWRTYGTWLPGDERGWIDERRNGYGEPMNRPDVRLEGAAAGLMKARATVFGSELRTAVEDAIREACAFREWPVVALAVRTNHVHLVRGTDEEPSRVLNALKSRTTRVLRERELVAQDALVWARGGSKRILWDDDALEATIRYVLYGQ